MMQPLTLKEFAQQLRMDGCEFADEIFDLIDLEEEIAEPYGNLCYDIEQYAKDFSNPDDASKALEWLGDRSNLLAEIEKALDEDGRTGDTDDQVKAMLETLSNIHDIIGAADTATDEDLETLIQALAERPAPTEYDL